MSSDLTASNELWIDRDDIRQSKIVQRELTPLKEGEVRVAIDKFGLTSNNVSYAVTGASIGYWGYYPAEQNWVKVPVWGCADVVESNYDDVPVGERLYGFFPMASHADLLPGNIMGDQFTDTAVHRQQLPALYNQYRRTKAEPDFLTQMENERCLYFPLFITSYVISDYLIDNDFFGAEQVVIGSVSSKTGFGLAQILKQAENSSRKVIGVTSSANKDFVARLECCDQIVEYGNEQQVDASRPTAYVDMSGDLRLTQALHNHCGDNLVESCIVGGTHWEEGGRPTELPGAKPRFFFAPSQIAKRDEDWGAGVVMAKAAESSAQIAKRVAAQTTIEWTRDAQSLQSLWLDILDNKVSGSRGQMVTLLSGN
jgi:NADPH:quinone reductase-like Zn-dependent oxidoreductase